MKSRDTKNRKPLTCEDTVGPYYPVQFLDDDRMDLTVLHPGLAHRPKGQQIVLKGRVFDINRKLATGVVLEFWQADANGMMRGPHNIGSPALDPAFDGFARCRVDGKYCLKTIMPGELAPEVAGEAARAPFINITIFSDGFSRLVTQAFFEGQSRNAIDPVLQAAPEPVQSRLVATRLNEELDGVPVYVFDIVLAGDGETPFFNDEPILEDQA